MEDTKWFCLCGGVMQYYNIGFDDGYQCKVCQSQADWHNLRERCKISKEDELATIGRQIKRHGRMPSE